MVAFFRQFLVVLLVLLQNAAPLVHAHTGGDASQTGFHLHEFETLRLAADHLSMAAAGHVVDAESCIVNVGSAIKRQQTAAIGSMPVFCPAGFNPFPATVLDAAIIHFSPHGAGFISQPFLSHNTSRAPPR